LPIGQKHLLNHGFMRLAPRIYADPAVLHGNGIAWDKSIEFALLLHDFRSATKLAFYVYAMRAQ
jgi:hypothetical protein